MFLTDLLSMSLNTVFAAVGICHTGILKMGKIISVCVCVCVCIYIYIYIYIYVCVCTLSLNCKTCWLLL
jgi:hypothetical protein